MSEQTPPEDQQPELTGKAKSISNLKPIKPGEVRNPNGRGKGTLNFATRIKKWLSAKELVTNPISKKKERLSQIDIMVLAQIEKARTGDVNSFNALLDRVEGKPVQKTILANDEDNPMPAPKQVIVLPGGQEIEF